MALHPRGLGEEEAEQSKHISERGRVSGSRGDWGIARGQPATDPCPGHRAALLAFLSSRFFLHEPKQGPVNSRVL